MAKPRKPWSQLAPGTRARKLRFYKKQGLSANQVASRYNAGKLGSQAAVRGHAKTPEHGLGQALKNPEKYEGYLRRKNQRIIGGGPSVTPEDEARKRNELLDKAYRNFHGRLQHYVHYNGDTVRANVYGGETAESGPVPGMSNAEAAWTAQADTEEIRSMASEQYRGNPWWYH